MSIPPMMRRESSQPPPPEQLDQNLMLLPPEESGSLDPRVALLRDRLKAIAPTVGYVSYFTFAFLLFLYLSFPYERVRDFIVAEFDRSQKAGPGRQVLTIASLSPSWLTGVVLKDVTLVTVPADGKAASSLTIDELRARVSLGSIFSAAKDVYFSAKAFGGTLDGSIRHQPSSIKEDEKRPSKDKDKGPRFDRMIKLELENLSLPLVPSLRDAIGAEVGGVARGSIDLTYVDGRADKASGKITFELENFWVSDGKRPFKVPALKAVFGSEDVTLPQINIGSVPIEVGVRNGVARIEKFEAKGKDLDIVLDGQVVLRENTNDTELGLNLRFKFNDSYRKKTDTTAGLLMMLDSEPRLRQGKRPDGSYALRVVGTLATGPQVVGAQGGPGGAPSPMGMP